MATTTDIMDERTKVIEQAIENWDDLNREMAYRLLWTMGHRIDGIESRIAALARREAEPK